MAGFGPALAEVLSTGLRKGAVVDDRGRPLEAQVPVVGPLFGLFFVPAGSGPVHDYDDAVASAATGLYGRWFRSMLERGVALAPGPYEVAFPSVAHGDTELEHTLDVAAEAMAEVAAT